MTRIIALVLVSALLFLGCTTTIKFGPDGQKISETKSFEVTAEHIAMLESLHAILLESVDAYVDLKGTIDDAEFEQELAEREAKADSLAAKIEALKALLAALPQPNKTTP